MKMQRIATLQLQQNSAKKILKEQLINKFRDFLKNKLLKLTQKKIIELKPKNSKLLAKNNL